MFENIGAKIKALAVGIMVIGIILYILIGIIVMFIGIGEEEGGMILIGFLIMALGTLIAWISSWFLYGYGELIDKVSKMEAKLPNMEQNYQIWSSAAASPQGNPNMPIPKKASQTMNLHEIARKMDLEVKEEKWICPKCGSKNNVGKMQCSSCGYYK